MEVNGTSWKYSKKISGNCYGIIKYGNNFISIDTDNGIFEFNKNFKILRSKRLPKHSRGHGLHYNEHRSEFYVVCSYLDAILVLDKKFNIKNKIQISNKIKLQKHLNITVMTVFHLKIAFMFQCFLKVAIGN